LPWSLGSARAARRWFAGPSCSKTSFPELTAKR
jgi:hypothetical protein